MLIKRENRVYEIIRGSSVSNEGINGKYLELYDVTVLPHEQLLSAFYSDQDNSLTFSAYRQDLPFSLVEIFVAQVRKDIAPVIENMTK